MLSLKAFFFRVIPNPLTACHLCTISRASSTQCGKMGKILSKPILLACFHPDIKENASFLKLNMDSCQSSLTISLQAIFSLFPNIQYFWCKSLAANWLLLWHTKKKPWFWHFLVVTKVSQPLRKSILVRSILSNFSCLSRCEYRYSFCMLLVMSRSIRKGENNMIVLTTSLKLSYLFFS